MKQENEPMPQWAQEFLIGLEKAAAALQELHEQQQEAPDIGEPPLSKLKPDEISPAMRAHMAEMRKQPVGKYIGEVTEKTFMLDEQPEPAMKKKVSMQSGISEDMKQFINDRKIQKSL